MAERRALVVTSDGSPGAVVTPILAALELTDLEIQVVDVGRAGRKADGAVGRFVQAIAAEFAERRLERVLVEQPYDVTVAFDAKVAAALSQLRDSSPRPFAVIAVVSELAPAAAWAQADADRYLAFDDEAAVALADRGIEGARILCVGPLAPYSFVAAAAKAKDQLRRDMKLAEDATVVIVRVDGLGYEAAGQIALQLALIEREVTFLFDAGSDTAAAEALRRQVPSLGLPAKLFGATPKVAQYWRAADVIVAPPTLSSVYRALVLGSPLIAMLGVGEGDDRLASAVAKRGFGAIASTPLLVPSVLESDLSGAGDGIVGVDGAGNVADICAVCAVDRAAVVSSSRAAEMERTRERVRRAAAYARASERAAAPPGELEDLSGATPVAQARVDRVDAAELASLRRDLLERIKRAQRTVTDARRLSDEARARGRLLEERGDKAAAAAELRRAEAEHRRMHATLEELAGLSRDLDEVSAAEKAPPPPASSASASTRPQPRSRRGGGTSTRAPRQSVDDMLEQLKREAGGGSASNGGGQRAENVKSRTSKPSKSTSRTSSVDDELAALKKRVQNKKKP